MYRVIIQHAAPDAVAPKSVTLRRWAKKVLQCKFVNAEITIRLVSPDEIAALNLRYRHKPGPTNILSFPFTMPAGVELDVPIIGDLVICADIVNQEALDQGKSNEAHWAHMVVHGIFHLLGYDHEKKRDAVIMEALETDMLKKLGFDNPYQPMRH